MPRSRRAAPRLPKEPPGVLRRGDERRPAFLSPPKPYPHRVTLDLTTEDHRALRMAAASEGTTMAEVLRALVALWQSDRSVAASVRDRIGGRADGVAGDGAS